MKNLVNTGQLKLPQLVGLARNYLLGKQLLECVTSTLAARKFNSYDLCASDPGSQQHSKGNQDWRNTKSYSKLGVVTLSAAVLLNNFTESNNQDEGNENSTVNKKPKTPLIPPNELPKRKPNPLSKKQAVEYGRELVQRKLLESGAPGISIAVSVNGNNVWTEGFGYSDAENRVKCHPFSVMRIASISKPVTMVAVAKLWEEGKLDLDVPIQTYLPEYPKKYVDGEEVTITVRHLLCHKSGIRHYSLKKEKIPEASSEPEGNSKAATSPAKDNTKIVIGKQNTSLADGEKSFEDKKNVLLELLMERFLSDFEKKEKEEKSEFDLKEYYIKESFETSGDALKLFQDDELFFKPGDDFLYSTHAWTVVAAVIESVTKKAFPKVLKSLFQELGLAYTFVEDNSSVIYNRARHYIRDKRGRLLNAPYVNNSYKMAGGGLLSNVVDLVKFGNLMLYSYQNREESKGNRGSGFLRSATVKMMWDPVDGTKMSGVLNGNYGLGWNVVTAVDQKAFCYEQHFYTSHTGGAVGGSSVLLIYPTSGAEQPCSPPQGIVVAILTNMQEVGLHAIALKIAQLFDRVEDDRQIVGHITDKPHAKVYSLNSSVFS